MRAGPAAHYFLLTTYYLLHLTQPRNTAFNRLACELARLRCVYPIKGVLERSGKPQEIDDAARKVCYMQLTCCRARHESISVAEIVMSDTTVHAAGPLAQRLRYDRSWLHYDWSRTNSDRRIFTAAPFTAATPLRAQLQPGAAWEASAPWPSDGALPSRTNLPREMVPCMHVLSFDRPDSLSR